MGGGIGALVMSWPLVVLGGDGWLWWRLGCGHGQGMSRNRENRGKQSAWSTLDNGDNGGEVIRPVERGKGREL